MQVHCSMVLARGYSTLPSPCFCLLADPFLLVCNERSTGFSHMLQPGLPHPGRQSHLSFPVLPPLFYMHRLEEDVSSGFLQGLFNQGEYKTSMKHFSYKPAFMRGKFHQAGLQFKTKTISIVGLMSSPEASPF